MKRTIISVIMLVVITAVYMSFAGFDKSEKACVSMYITISGSGDVPLTVTAYNTGTCVSYPLVNSSGDIWVPENNTVPAGTYNVCACNSSSKGTCVVVVPSCPGSVSNSITLSSGSCTYCLSLGC